MRYLFIYIHIMLSRQSTNLCRFLFMAISLIISACGSVHQFMPPQPLKPNEFRCTLTLSYDSNLFAPLGNWGSSFYWGAGKDINIGLGGPYPTIISHLTAVKYFNPQRQELETISAGIGFVPMTLAYLKFTAAYSVHKGAGFHTISTGLIKYSGVNSSIYDTRLTSEHSKPLNNFHPRIGTFGGYEFTNGDYAISIMNIPGLTSNVISFERKFLENRERIVLPYDDLSAINFDPRSNRMSIKMNDSTDYRITPYSPYVDKWGPDWDLLRLRRFNPKDSWNYYFVQRNANSKYFLRLYELEFNAIWLSYADRQDIVLGSFPARKRDIFKMIKWYKHDWSIGLGMKI